MRQKALSSSSPPPPVAAFFLNSHTPFRLLSLSFLPQPPPPPTPSFPYAGALAAGGILAWANKKSLHSLVFAGIASSVLCLAALRSLAAFDRGETSKGATAVSLAVSLVLTAGMGQRYLETGKSYPGLWVAGPSAFMALFYVWCLSRPAAKGGKGKKGAAKKKVAAAAAPAGSPAKRVTRAAAASKKRA